MISVISVVKIDYLRISASDCPQQVGKAPYREGPRNTTQPWLSKFGAIIHGPSRPGGARANFSPQPPRSTTSKLDNIPKTKKIIYARQHDFLCEIREAAGLIIWGKIRAMTQKRYRITGGHAAGQSCGRRRSGMEAPPGRTATFGDERKF